MNIQRIERILDLLAMPKTKANCDLIYNQILKAKTTDSIFINDLLNDFQEI